MASGTGRRSAKQPATATTTGTSSSRSTTTKPRDGSDGAARSTKPVSPPAGTAEPVVEPIISLRDVKKAFGSHTVLEGISFDVPKGRISAILGPSGTGKSVLLKNIIGLLRPERGEIWVEDEQIVGMGEKDLYRVRRKMGVLFQDGALFGSMSPYDNTPF